MEKNQRLMSLDALRGFDMMIIIGVDAIAGCLAAPPRLSRCTKKVFLKV